MLIRSLGHKRGCRAAVQIPPNVVVVLLRKAGRGTAAALELLRDPLGNNNDRFVGPKINCHITYFRTLSSDKVTHCGGMVPEAQWGWARRRTRGGQVRPGSPGRAGGSKQVARAVGAR